MKILISEGMETTRRLKFGRVAHQVQVYNHKYWSLDILFRFLDFIFWMAILAQKTVIFDLSEAKLIFQKFGLILGMNVYTDTLQYPILEHFVKLRAIF